MCCPYAPVNVLPGEDPSTSDGPNRGRSTDPLYIPGHSDKNITAHSGVSSTCVIKTISYMTLILEITVKYVIRVRFGTVTLRNRLVYLLVGMILTSVLPVLVCVICGSRLYVTRHQSGYIPEKGQLSREQKLLLK